MKNISASVCWERRMRFCIWRFHGRDGSRRRSCLIQCFILTTLYAVVSSFSKKQTCNKAHVYDRSARGINANEFVWCACCARRRRNRKDGTDLICAIKCSASKWKIKCVADATVVARSSVLMVAVSVVLLQQQFVAGAYSHRAESIVVGVSRFSFHLLRSSGFIFSFPWCSFSVLHHIAVLPAAVCRNMCACRTTIYREFPHHRQPKRSNRGQ